MAVEFDPAWEYWCPEDELEQEVSFDLLDLNRFRTDNVGFRFGQGDPNKSPAFRLARSRPERIRGKKSKQCRQCSRPFTPKESRFVFCSRKCFLERWELREKSCDGCGKIFRPKHYSASFCSRPCAARSAAAGRSGTGSDEVAERNRVVLEMHRAGFRNGEIAGKCGISPARVCKVLKDAGVVLGRSGPRKGHEFSRGKMLKTAFVKDAKVRINNPEIPQHGKEVVVEQVESWGCHLTGTGVGTGKYRALWSEMVLLDSKEGRVQLAREMGYTSDICPTCQAMTMKRNGSCLLCDSCGQSSGCS